MTYSPEDPEDPSLKVSPSSDYLETFESPQTLTQSTLYCNIVGHQHRETQKRR
jgi:hypothetical protein